MIKSIRFRKITTLAPVPAAMRGYSPVRERIEVDAANVAGVLVNAKLNGKDDVQTRKAIATSSA